MAEEMTGSGRTLARKVSDDWRTFGEHLPVRYLARGPQENAKPFLTNSLAFSVDHSGEENSNRTIALNTENRTSSLSGSATRGAVGTPIEANLATLIEAWPRVPEEARKCIAILIRSDSDNA